MAYTTEELSATGYGGAPVPLLRFAQAEPTGHLAVVLPGLRSRCEQPAPGLAFLQGYLPG